MGSKIAIPRYRGRISPRFIFAQDILVVEMEGMEVKSREVIPMNRRSPYAVPEMLYRRGVELMLTGGIHLHFQHLFTAFGIKVIWGLIGTPEEALKAYMTGIIRTGMGNSGPGGTVAGVGAVPSGLEKGGV